MKEDVKGEKLEQQPAARNTSLRITKELANWVNNAKNVTGDEDLIQVAADALGTDSPELAFTTIREMIGLHGGLRCCDTKINAGLALLSGFQCKDPLELMMAKQLITLHTRAMDLAREDAARSTFNPGVNNLDETLKVMRVFQGLLETFNRYRRNQALLMKDSKPDAHLTASAAANADQNPQPERNE